MERKASTAQYGSIEKPFDICKLVEACGATFVARGTAFHAKMLDAMMLRALNHKGFSVVEAMSQCPVQYGRRNKLGTPMDMMQWFKDNSVSSPVFDKIPPDEVDEQFPVGVLVNKEEKDYIDRYRDIVKKAGGEVP